MESSSSRIPLLLLKTKSTPQDGYQEYFESAENGDYQPIFVPVLQHQIRKDSLNTITDLIVSSAFKDKATGEREYGGIIFTSQRAVEAFIKVVTEMSRSIVDAALDDQTPLYVVGPATARGLRTLGLACPILGESSGNGEALAAFIQEDCSSRWGSRSKRPDLLFLVGEQRRDIIPKTLQSKTLPPNEQIAIHELEVYGTAEMETFAANFASIWAKEEKQDQWVVVFSPTGCKAMLSVIGLLDSKTGKYNGAAHKRTKIATIGPTTRDYLLREFEFHPDVCAPRPSPEGVGLAIQEFSLNRSTD